MVIVLLLLLFSCASLLAAHGEGFVTATPALADGATLG
jgi:hypothetical protein